MAKTIQTRVQTSAQAQGVVHKSTLYICVIIALLAGLFAGSLLPSLRPAAVHTASSAPAAAPAAPMPEQQNDMQARIAAEEKLVLQHPNEAGHWIELGNLYFETNNPQKSINAYSKALALQPNNADVMTDMGVMQRELKEYDKALASFLQAAEINKSHEQSLFNAGIVLYYDLKKTAEAKKVWQQLLLRNPQAKAPTGQPLAEMLQSLP
jgi:tetratricopeptide (TPR) repeat protein